MYSSHYYFWPTFLALCGIMYALDQKYALLRDSSTVAIPKERPHSFAKVQLAWWTSIILSSLITTMLMTGDIPTFNESTLILLGIGTATAAAGKLIDISDETKNAVRSQDSPKEKFLLDILSDENGVSLTRLQSLVFNVTFGLWFIFEMLNRTQMPGTPLDQIIPSIETNNLVLLGLSSATYAAFKTTENKK